MSAGTFRRTRLESDIAAEAIAARDELRRRLRLLVERTDELVDACEAAHLTQGRRASDELVGQVFEVLGEAREVLSADRRRAPLCMDVIHGGRPREAPLVRQLMDLIWTIQGAMFDQLLPWRRELDDNEEEEYGVDARAFSGAEVRSCPAAVR